MCTADRIPFSTETAVIVVAMRDSSGAVSLKQYVDAQPTGDFAAFVAADAVGNGEHHAVGTLDKMSARVFIIRARRSDVGQQRQLESLLDRRRSGGRRIHLCQATQLTHLK